MKKLNKIISLCAVATLLAIFPGENTLTASAAEPSTYYVKYIPAEDDWRFQIGSSWNDEEPGREMYYLNENMEDGDLAVVDADVSSKILKLPAHLSNLTVNHASTVVIYTNGVDECYVLDDSVAAINGNIKNAYLYGNAKITFNDSITNLNIIGTSDINAHATVAGTVDHVIGKDDLKTYYDCYNVERGKLVIEDGGLRTEAKYYSTAPSKKPASSSSSSNTDASDYDDVPKTGDSNLVFLLSGIAAACIAGKYALKKVR